MWTLIAFGNSRYIVVYTQPEAASPLATVQMLLFNTCIWQERLELLVDPEGQRQSSATVVSAAPPSHVLCCPLWAIMWLVPTCPVLEFGAVSVGGSAAATVSERSRGWRLTRPGQGGRPQDQDTVSSLQPAATAGTNFYLDPLTLSHCGKAFQLLSALHLSPENFSLVSAELLLYRN